MERKNYTLTEKAGKKNILHGPELTRNRNLSTTFCCLPENAANMLQDNVGEAKDQNRSAAYY